MPALPSKGGPISPTMVGFVGSLMSRIRTPGCGCGQFAPGPRGSPTPHVFEPSVRLPTYKKWSKIAGAAFMPRLKSGFWPTRTKFDDVPGVPPPGPTPTAACAAPGMEITSKISASMLSRRRVMALLRSVMVLSTVSILSSGFRRLCILPGDYYGYQAEFTDHVGNSPHYESLR